MPVVVLGLCTTFLEFLTQFFAFFPLKAVSTGERLGHGRRKGTGEHA